MKEVSRKGKSLSMGAPSSFMGTVKNMFPKDLERRVRFFFYESFY